MGLALLGQLIRREHDSREVGTEVGTTQGENVSSEYLQISLRNIRKGRDFGQDDQGCGDGVGMKRGAPVPGSTTLNFEAKHIRIHFNSLARRRGQTDNFRAASRFFRFESSHKQLSTPTSHDAYSRWSYKVLSNFWYRSMKGFGFWAKMLVKQTP